MKQVTPSAIRYIKLGKGGSWAKWALEVGEIPFGYPGVGHDACQQENWEAIAERLVELGRKSKQSVTSGVREVKEFYTLGEDTLWVTLEFGALWWAYADTDVKLYPIEEGGPTRYRKAVDGWQREDIEGNPLLAEQLSTSLTQLAAYRGTVCRVANEDYLLRRINAEPEPIIVKAKKVREQMVSIAAEMITNLHWADFEVLVDLIFSRSGWQRTSGLGGTLKDVDLALENASTGERAFVQVKSKASQAVLEDYIERFQRYAQYQRMFFVCHTPVGINLKNSPPNVYIWTNEILADAAVKSALFDWLLMRSN